LIVRVQQCRVCEGPSLEPFLDLGPTALANSFVRPDCPGADEPRFPLRAVLCGDCGLVQIDEEVPPGVLFRDYIYVSGTSDLVRTHADFLAEKFVACGLRPGDLVVEAASNDGTVLRAFQRRSLRVLGVEPAANIAARANAEGVETVCEFFNADTAARVREHYGPARLVLGRHVLAHVADLHGFVAGFPRLLAPDGLAAVEVPYLLPFHDNLEYDTIYHEHLCYFSVRILQRLFERWGLELLDVQEVAIHGGSIVVTAQHRGGPRRPDASVARHLAREEGRGLHRPAPWRAYAHRVAQSRAALLGELDRLARAGHRLAGYGAPAKGMTLLSYCGIGPDRLPYLVDKSPYKQGLLTPGHHIPVLPPTRLLEDQPDVVLVLAWNFAAEIAAQQAEYLGRGGKLLLPIPQAHYWN
jgi:novobiocin biosynthesis protein NovU/D-mycarose 3-C-methyltransferase